jgi:hypothetical protein
VGARLCLDPRLHHLCQQESTQNHRESIPGPLRTQKLLLGFKSHSSGQGLPVEESVDQTPAEAYYSEPQQNMAPCYINVTSRSAVDCRAFPVMSEVHMLGNGVEHLHRQLILPSLVFSKTLRLWEGTPTAIENAASLGCSLRWTKLPDPRQRHRSPLLFENRAEVFLGYGLFACPVSLSYRLCPDASFAF